MRHIFKEKNYKHIDKKATIKDIENKVKDTNFVIHHNFYPFLSYEIKFVKFVKKKKKKFIKKKQDL